MSLFIRKILITFAIASVSFFVGVAPSLIDAFEKQDWSNLKTLAWSAVFGVAAAGGRAVISLLTAWVPTDADVGVNLTGKYAKRDG